MKFKKIAAIILTICIASTAMVQKSSATEMVNFNNSTVMEQVSEIFPITKNKILINDKYVDLYVEFENYGEAFEIFCKNFRNELKVIGDKIGEQELSLENWERFYSGIRQFEQSVENSTVMLGFFDIFENSFKNIEATSYYEYIYSKRSEPTDEELEELSYLIPYTSEIKTSKGIITSLPLNTEVNNEIILEEGEKKAPQPLSRAYGINLTNAVNYASKHSEAGTYNSPTYNYFFTGDCTNFVSQVLAAGGVSQISNSSANSGWWFRRTNSSDPYNPYIYSHSLSWIRADSFARYWGVSYTTRSHAAFSGKIYAGEIIAFDESSDGDWDHLGFVTQADDYTANYGGKIYYDYKVAQHTSDYHAWTSTSRNGWEKLEDSGHTYALIRK